MASSTRERREKESQLIGNILAEEEPEDDVDVKLPNGTDTAAAATNLTSSQGGVQVAPRPKSAPPSVVDQQALVGMVVPEGISPDDPRLDPNYYRYYYSQKPLDPRLPPPLFTPATWGAARAWGFEGGAPEDGKGGGVATVPDEDEEAVEADGGADGQASAPANQQAKPSPPLSPIGKPVQAHGSKKTPLDMIQQDFPRTPSPIYQKPGALPMDLPAGALPASASGQQAQQQAAAQSAAAAQQAAQASAQQAAAQQQQAAPSGQQQAAAQGRPPSAAALLSPMYYPEATQEAVALAHQMQALAVADPPVHAAKGHAALKRSTGAATPPAPSAAVAAAAAAAAAYAQAQAQAQAQAHMTMQQLRHPNQQQFAFQQSRLAAAAADGMMPGLDGTDLSALGLHGLDAQSSAAAAQFAAAAAYYQHMGLYASQFVPVPIAYPHMQYAPQLLALSKDQQARLKAAAAHPLAYSAAAPRVALPPEYYGWPAASAASAHLAPPEDDPPVLPAAKSVHSLVYPPPAALRKSAPEDQLLDGSLHTHKAGSVLGRAPGAGKKTAVAEPPASTGKKALSSSTGGSSSSLAPGGVSASGSASSLGSSGEVATARSTLLEEFRNNKNNKKFELADIVGHVVEFSGDQHGSRFIQQKLETASVADKNLVFAEIAPHALPLMTDVFGNYVIQKFFEYGTAEHKRVLTEKLAGQVLSLAIQMYGCRVIQKALEANVDVEQQSRIVRELHGHVMQCVKDQNGNHVIQKCIERVHPQLVQFIVDAFHGQVYALATHPYGCRVIQRILEHCPEEQTAGILDELLRCTIALVQDQYGNYVIQHVLEHGQPRDKAAIMQKLRGQLLQLSQHKFASNVVEKCVQYSQEPEKTHILEEVLSPRPDGALPLHIMMKDQYANYVVQKMLDVYDEPARDVLIARIRPHFASLKKFTYGKHIITRIEKLRPSGAPTPAVPY